MQEISSPYTKGDGSFFQSNRAWVYATFVRVAKKRTRFSLANISLIQKILMANLLLVMAGAIVGSYLTAQLAEAGQFTFFTFLVMIVVAVLIGGIISFTMLKVAFRPFEEFQRVIARIHAGNPRARAALENINDPDVRRFTNTVNQMLTRLEENARVIQEDQRLLQLMTARVINAQENERKRIARELHDEASQALTAMVLGLESAKQNLPPENRMLEAKLDGLKQLAISTLEEIRKLALDLRPTMLDDLGLLPAVRWLCRTTEERAELVVKVRLEGFDEDERHASEVETCLFRITQESLTNILRHAAAKHVEIKLEHLSSFESNLGDGWGAVRLTIKDDGQGFRPAEAKIAAYQGGHLGLFDIEERAALLGGKVEIESHCAGDGPSGTKVIVTVPLSGKPVDLMAGLDTNAMPYAQCH
ncbi:MAG: sensor histidine kinase [Chloroflexota bacterium]